jgi:hypothetical protein
MRILITGSRHWTDRAPVWYVLQRICAANPGPHALVHGDCERGIDRLVVGWALDIGCEYDATHEPHPADWARNGRAAGPKRNQAMVDLGADICLAWPGPGSKGTFDCMRRAAKAGIRVVNFGAQPAPPPSDRRIQQPEQQEASTA